MKQMQPFHAECRMPITGREEGNVRLYLMCLRTFIASRSLHGRVSAHHNPDLLRPAR